MEKNYQDYRALAMDILHGQWLIQESPALRTAARRFLERNTSGIADLFKYDRREAFLMDLKGRTYDLLDLNAQPGDEKLIFVMPIHGTLTKYDNCIGCATMYVADKLEEYRTRDDIVGFVLDIDSPGGACNAIMPVVSEIRKIQADGKPVIAHVDLCASAAYWIASQTDAIFTDNLMSSVGSIGAYYAFIDDRENKQTGEHLVEIYAPESTDKNRAFREALDGKPELAQKELSETVQRFISDVKAGRPGIKADAEGVMSGAMFEAAKALELGMTDSMGDLQSCVEIAYIRAIK